MPPQWQDPWFWFEKTHQHQSASSIRDRRNIVLALATWLALPDNGAIHSPGEVTKRHLSAYIAMIESTRKGSGALTVFNGLRVFFRWYTGEFKGCEECADPVSYKNHSCPLNPLHGVHRPSPAKHPSVTVPVPTQDQVAKVLATLSGRDYQSVRDRALISLLADTGTRREEIRNIDVADLDLSIRGGGIAQVRVSKTKPRPVVFSPATATYLGRLLRMHPLKDDPAWPDVPLFANSGGGRLSPQSIGVIVARAGRRAGVEFPDGRRLHPHQMRHGWADQMYRDGAPDSVLRQLGGWSGTIPATYAAGTREDRAVEYGLQRFGKKR
jgi:integrase